MQSVGDISVHRDFYNYWDVKRGTRPMPARADVDPVDIPLLLPYVTLIEREPGGFFRYRLMGTAVSRQLGRDLTGQRVGHYVRPATYGAKMHAIYEQVFSTGHPLFTTGEYKTAFGTVHATCRLTTPLGIEGNVTMVMATRIARSIPNIAADWALSASGQVLSASPVTTIEDVERLSHEWDIEYPTRDS